MTSIFPRLLGQEYHTRVNIHGGKFRLATAFDWLTHPRESQVVNSSSEGKTFAFNRTEAVEG